MRFRIDINMIKPLCMITDERMNALFPQDFATDRNGFVTPMRDHGSAREPIYSLR